MSEEHKVSLAAEQVHPALVEDAAAIKALGKRVVGDLIEIGRRLTRDKDICGHGHWLPWLDREFGWSDKTAENFINVYKLGSKSENFSNLNLPLSGLYLLAAPSTPDEARTEIIERAQTGKSVSVAAIKQTIDTAKGRQPRNFEHAKIFREMKLGKATIDKLEGTTLASAREQDELVFLNRGASEGELTEPVRDLVACAVRGEKVSAIEYRKSGAAYRREKVSVSNVPQQREAAAGRLRGVMGGKAHDNSGPTVTGEVAHQDARGELEVQLGHVRAENIALRSQVRELTRALEDKLAGLSNERLHAELERRLSPQFLKAHRAAIKAIRCALDAPEQHSGPTLELEADHIADSAVTKH